MQYVLLIFTVFISSLGRTQDSKLSFYNDSIAVVDVNYAAVSTTIIFKYRLINDRIVFTLLDNPFFELKNIICNLDSSCSADSIYIDIICQDSSRQSKYYFNFLEYSVNNICYIKSFDNSSIDYNRTINSFSFEKQDGILSLSIFDSVIDFFFESQFDPVKCNHIILNYYFLMTSDPLDINQDKFLPKKVTIANQEYKVVFE